MSKNLQPLTQEELETLTAELNAVLVKHNAEMSVSSTISLMKVVEVEETINESENSSETEEESDTKAA